MTDQLTTSSVVQQNTNLLAQNIDGDVIVLHLETNEYYGLQSVAHRIWELIEQPTVIAAVVDAITEEYNANRSTVENDTLEFLQHLLGKDLIALSSGTGASSSDAS
ncbi:MAG: PqqD family protein [Anaerolineae bacterium]|nr:PqqD family protein [Anaerolineae bacterium]